MTWRHQAVCGLNKRGGAGGSFRALGENNVATIARWTWRRDGRRESAARRGEGSKRGMAWWRLTSKRACAALSAVDGIVFGVSRIDGGARNCCFDLAVIACIFRYHPTLSLSSIVIPTSSYRAAISTAALAARIFKHIDGADVVTVEPGEIDMTFLNCALYLAGMVLY